MKINTAKAKMLAGGTAFGFELGMGSATIAEALSRTGIDYLQLDNQHGDWGPDSTIAALIAMEGGTATPMARVARNDYTMIGRLRLDNLDECVLCRLCIDAAPPGSVTVRKLYDGGATL